MPCRSSANFVVLIAEGPPQKSRPYMHEAQIFMNPADAGTRKSLCLVQLATCPTLHLSGVGHLALDLRLYWHLVHMHSKFL